MEKTNLMEELIKELGIEQHITLEDIPDIDLYMDQVIQLFERKFNDLKRNENEKILTKTMINNYAKGKLFFPITNKKYSKEHIILISLIYNLKGAISINDIKKTLQPVNQKMESGELNLDALYSVYLELAMKNAEKFQQDFDTIVTETEDAASKLNDNEQQFNDDLEKVLLIGSLVNMSNLYRKAAEKLIDTLDDEPIQPKK
ncbi:MULTISPECIES: DUF1836 domain-containing protein [Bacillaceae]|uniref:DUF1836 domain-containing protein n=1 Tax=Evansella alkalicola TaxID=745819 RepID=A0ABS6JUD8_9BACI|nr:MULTISPECIES: DUF1836 domain-containing protein [Bacillaceae]MBU9722198.1 DUF1836 domain-containing protein [Bacillus alkalicola]